MHRINELSKSTKRRRLLEEQCLHNHLIEIDSVQINEVSQKSNFLLNSTSSVRTAELNYNNSSTSTNLVEPNCVLNSNYDLLEESGEESLPNDSSDDPESESDEYIPQNQPLISKLADWAINDNVPNSTFSDLLKI